MCVCVTHLQAMSGDSTCYWDPSGQALAQTVREMRQQAPRGRSVNHTQPDLGQRFAHEWEPWSACRAERTAAVGQPPPSSSSDGSSGSRQATHVADALYLRLPLRLQDQKLQGSAIAAAAGARLGLASRVAGLSLEDVRQQVRLLLQIRLHVCPGCWATTVSSFSLLGQRPPCGSMLLLTCADACQPPQLPVLTYAGCAAAGRCIWAHCGPQPAVPGAHPSFVCVSLAGRRPCACQVVSSIPGDSADSQR